MFCGAKLPFLFSILFYLLSGNDTFQLKMKSEEKKDKSTKRNDNLQFENCRFFLEAPPRFELGVKALQARALPLGHGAILNYIILMDKICKRR